MKNLLFTLLLSVSVLSSYAQSDAKKDSIPIIKEELKQPNEKLNHYLNIEDNPHTDKSSDIFTNSLNIKPTLGETEMKTFDFTTPALREPSSPPMTLSPLIHNPFANDYKFSSGLGLADNVWISTSSGHTTYPTLGENRVINANLNYRPANWLIISGGVYGAKYSHIYGGLQNRYYNDVGANAHVKFIVHDRIRFNVFGQYSAYGDKNRISGPMMHMYPQTYYGGSIEVKVTDKFGVEGGLIRELNPFNGKWVNRPFIAPVFYGN